MAGDFRGANRTAGHDSAGDSGGRHSAGGASAVVLLDGDDVEGEEFGGGGCGLRCGNRGGCGIWGYLRTRDGCGEGDEDSGEGESVHEDEATAWSGCGAIGD